MHDKYHPVWLHLQWQEQLRKRPMERHGPTHCYLLYLDNRAGGLGR